MATKVFKSDVPTQLEKIQIEANYEAACFEGNFL
jgi:hypothetical protein